MKPVLISKNKPIGIMSLIILFLVLSVSFWYLARYFSLMSLLSAKLELINLPVYMEYLVVGVSAWLMAYMVHAILKRLQLKKLALIVFSINLAVDSSYHYVQAPAAMLSSDFLKLFFKYLSNGKSKDKYSIILRQYLPMLEIRRNDMLVRFNGEESLSEGGLKNGDICQIIGKSKVVT